jgi:hypothetical protein
MIFLLGIVFSIIFAAAVIKKGLYVNWARLVNLVLSIYLSVFLTPSISRCSTFVAETRYGYPLCMIIIAAAVFLILHTFTTTFLTGIFKISFPKFLNLTGSAVLGFICGLLVWSFGCFVILLTPIPHSSIAQSLKLPSQLVQASVTPLRMTCGFVNFCSFQGEKADAAKVLDSLLYVEEDQPPEEKSWIEDEPLEDAEEVHLTSARH